MRWIDRLVKVSLNCGYVTEEQLPWLRYTLERRISTLLVAIPLICLLISFVILFVIGFEAMAKGIVLGVLLTSFSLVVAKINKRRFQNGY